LYYASIYRLEQAVELTRVSPKFQVVIPKKIRQGMELKPGEQLQVLQDGDSIRLVRVRSIADLRGIAKGLKWKDLYRDRSDRY
jgi:AbrB family looped-hinge helix DNA binding protein